MPSWAAELMTQKEDLSSHSSSSSASPKEQNRACITETQQAALYIYIRYIPLPASPRRENRRQIPSITATDPSQKAKRGRCGVWWGSKRHTASSSSRGASRGDPIHQPVVLASCWMLQLRVTSLSNAVLLFQHHIGSPFIYSPVSLCLSLPTLSALITAKLDSSATSSFDQEGRRVVSVCVCVCGFKQFIKWREREKRSWGGFCDEPV